VIDFNLPRQLDFGTINVARHAGHTQLALAPRNFPGLFHGRCSSVTIMSTRRESHDPNTSPLRCRRGPGRQPDRQRKANDGATPHGAAYFW
jgi:hypothetical protein